MDKTIFSRIKNLRLLRVQYKCTLHCVRACQAKSWKEAKLQNVHFVCGSSSSQQQQRHCSPRKQKAHFFSFSIECILSYLIWILRLQQNRMDFQAYLQPLILSGPHEQLNLLPIFRRRPLKGNFSTPTNRVPNLFRTSWLHRLKHKINAVFTYRYNKGMGSNQQSSCLV